jgi:O-antigen/teichoic acid export membrane protein
MASTSRNVLANYVGQAWTVALGFAFIPFYVATLGAEGYGIVGFFLVAQAWLPLLDLGMLPAMNREFARFAAGAHDGPSIRNLLRSVELLCLVPALIIVAGVLLGAVPIADHWLKVETLPLGMVVLSLNMIAIVIALRLYEGVYRGALLGASLQTGYNIAMVVMGTLRHVGAVMVLKFVSPTVGAFFIWQAFISLVTVGVLGLMTYKYLRPVEGRGTWSRPAIASIWTFATTSALTTVLGIVLSQTDKVLLSSLLPLASFGVFTLALTVCTVLPLLLNPICTAVYPRLVECATRGNNAELSRIYHQGSQLLAILVIPVALTLAFFSFDVMRAWTGSTEIAASAGRILSWYVVGSMFSAIVQLPAYLQLAHGWTTLAAGLNLVAVAVLVPLLLLTVPRFGVAAAAIIWALLNLGYLVFMVGIMHRRLLAGEQWRWYGKAVLLPMLAALAVVGSSWLTLHDFIRGLGRPGIFAVGLVLVLAVMGAAAVTDIGGLLWQRVREWRGAMGGGARP